MTLENRPRHGGLPIPYVTAIIDGKPDFRVHDLGNRHRCAVRQLCQLCGEPLSEPTADQTEMTRVLIGFAGSVDRNSFGEPPMHPLCFDFAWENCPWLNGRGYHERAGDVDAVTTWLDRPDEEQPMGVVWTSRTTWSLDREGLLVWHADPAPTPSLVEWRDR